MLTLLLIITSRSKILFFFSLISGLVISISSSSWLIIWVGLEINLLSFIPLISSPSNQYKSETGLKYFLVQALGSSSILVGLLSVSYLSYSSDFIITSALLVKIGGAPFHFWFIEVIAQLNWLQIIILNTFQKIAPITLVSYVTQTIFSQSIVTISIVLSAFLGAVGGFNQRVLSKIIAYSSLRHIAWILQRILISFYLWLLYFRVYCILVSSICLTFYVLKLKHLNQFINKAEGNILTKIIIAFPLISLAGLPPFSGFITKIMVISHLIRHTHIFITAVLIISSLLGLFFYFRIFLNSLILSSDKKKSSIISITLEGSYKLNITLYFNFFILLFPRLVLILL